MNHISRDPDEAVVVLASYRTFYRSRALRIDQKGFIPMKDVIQIFTSTGLKAVDPQPYTFTETKPCSLLPRHHHFVACETGSIRFKKSLLEVLYVDLCKIIPQ